MKNKGIVGGHAYVAKISGVLTLVRVVEKIVRRSFTGQNKHTRFVCVNLQTMLRISCTAAKFLRRASEVEVDQLAATGGKSYHSPVAQYTPAEAQVRKERSCGR